MLMTLLYFDRVSRYRCDNYLNDAHGRVLCINYTQILLSFTLFTAFGKVKDKHTCVCIHMYVISYLFILLLRSLSLLFSTTQAVPMYMPITSGIISRLSTQSLKVQNGAQTNVLSNSCDTM